MYRGVLVVHKAILDVQGCACCAQGHSRCTGGCVLVVHKAILNVQGCTCAQGHSRCTLFLWSQVYDLLRTRSPQTKKGK